ncbi:hypothetical protein SK128_018884 [Halocaridina rubra]|uniref:Uncharacterized protein n=1 Tax=Halocaridina rubra TaxID=373956 RepID=A0AAN8WM80_HALRR
MARSIKSRRGKAARRALRARYAKKKEAHLKKIVEKAKENELEDMTNWVYLHPRVRAAVDAKAEKEKKEKKEEAEAAAVEASTSADGLTAKERLELKARKKMRNFHGNIETLRDNKSGKMPKWMSQRQVRKNYFAKKAKKFKPKGTRPIKIV